MPDATITSTASTFGTITGTFAADQSTITGTVTGVVVGTLDGSVGVPGIGVPDGGTTGQVLKKASNTSYDTVWGTDLASAAWGTITGTLSSQTDLQTALDAKAPLASPAFTGNPTAPTAALADNDTSIATTAFVQQELASGVAVAKNLEVYVRNQTGSTLTAGTIVYINGATGNRPTVTKAQANNDANSAQTFGFVKTSIANNGFGYVIVRGECENLDTSALTEGAQLYLSPTTAGTWTTTKPSAPQHLVYVGIVVRAHPTQGVILVAIQNGYELNEIHDVLIDTPSNGQVLKYDAAQGLWINGTDSSGVAWGGITGTLSSQTDLNTALGLKYDASNPSGFITSAALSPYLTSATAASTYQTIAGMSSYLTTSAAASTYAPLASPTFTGTVTIPAGASISGYATTASLSSYAPLASPALTGTPTSTTAAADTNTTQIATTAYVVGQASSTSPVMDGSATVGTSLKYARADHVHPTDTSLAPLASPALTGTPTAPTASAGTNTTQIATTAFVTAAVPSFATFTTPTKTSTTTIVSPRIAIDYIMHPGRTEWMKFGSSATSGTGAAVFGGNTAGLTARWNQIYGPNTATAGYSMAVWDTTDGNLGMLAFTRGITIENRTWNKGIWASGRGAVGGNNNTFNGDANTTVRVSVGGKSSVGSGAINSADPGFGWLIPGMGNAMQLQVSNGTTVTTVTSSFTPVARQVFDWKMYSDGTGNVTLWINDSEVATTTSGPNTSSSETLNFYFEMVEQTVSTATRIVYNSFNSRVWWGV